MDVLSLVGDNSCHEATLPIIVNVQVTDRSPPTISSIRSKIIVCRLVVVDLFDKDNISNFLCHAL